MADLLGDRRATLEALQVELADAVTTVAQSEPAKLAPLAKQLADVVRELDSLAKPKGSKVDDLAEKRALRLAGAPSAAQAAVDN